MNSVVRNLEYLAAEIAATAVAAGREPSAVRIVAVSKTVAPAAILAAYDAGHRLFGENRVQDMCAKAAQLPEDCQWHFIGPLQKNKVRQAVKTGHWLHGLDTVALVERVDRIAGEEGRRLKVLVQVNVSGEASKHGCRPDEAAAVVAAVLRSSHLECLGLMTIGVYGASVERTRGYFRALRILRDEVAHDTGARLPELSMGMTDDFKLAIKEGATLVRIGTAIFGSRKAPAGL